MSTKRLRSRILQYFNKSLLQDLYKITKNNTVSDNNIKADVMIETLQRHGVDFVELGPGTNRLAILIDNYVFKIALDKWGMRDNLNEFTVSKELQPYVVKTYETNELISVCEYVTLISKEEFEEQKEVIRDILSIIGESYLLGDVGTVGQNFCNWGYRDNGELVILDFAYIFRIQGDELLCSKDKSILNYDENFHNLICPKCGKKYTFMDIRRRITMEQEKRENEIAKQLAYKLTKPFVEVASSYKEEELKASSLYKSKQESNVNKEESVMRNEDYYISREESEESYLEALSLMKKIKSGTTEEDDVPKLDTSSKVETNKIEIYKETPTETTSIKFIKQTKLDEQQFESEDSSQDMYQEEGEELDLYISDDELEGVLEYLEEEYEEIHTYDPEGNEYNPVTYEVAVETVNNQNLPEEKMDEKVDNLEQVVEKLESDNESEVVYTNEIKVNDNVQITNTVRIKTDDTDVEKLREELSNEFEEYYEENDEEDHLVELASDFLHLEDELDEEINRRKRNKTWK
ncbi:MAG: hypothetical protein ACK4F9_06910 [Brevinematia bacterium]